MVFYYAGGPKGVYLYHITINVINELSHSTPLLLLSLSLHIPFLSRSLLSSLNRCIFYLSASVYCFTFCFSTCFSLPLSPFPPTSPPLSFSFFFFPSSISPNPLSFLAPSFSPLTHILENGLFLLINIMFYLFCVLIDAFSFFSQY